MQGAGTANASGVRSHALCRQVTEGDMSVLCYPVWLTASCIASSQLSTQDKAIQVLTHQCIVCLQVAGGIWLRRIFGDLWEGQSVSPQRLGEALGRYAVNIISSFVPAG